MTMGRNDRVENTEPRSADGPLIPTPQTILRTNPQSTQNNQRNLLLGQVSVEQSAERGPVLTLPIY